MNLSDTISILLSPGHWLYKAMPGYAKSITFGNAIFLQYMWACKLKKGISIAEFKRLRFLFISFSIFIGH